MFFEYVLKLSWWQSWKYLVVNFSNITFPFFVVKQNAELSTSRRAFSSTNFHHGSIFGRIFSPETSQFKDFFIKKCVFFFESLLYIDRSIDQSINLFLLLKFSHVVDDRNFTLVVNPYWARIRKKFTILAAKYHKMNVFLHFFFKQI